LKEADKRIWIIVKDLFKYWIDASEKEIDTIEKECRKDDLSTPRLKYPNLCFNLDYLARLLNETYPNQKFSYYFHMIIDHLPELLFEYGCISQFSNQGTEAIHYLAQIQFTQTNNGGKIGGVITNPLHQIFMINLRRFFLFQQFDIKWPEVITSKDVVWIY